MKRWLLVGMLACLSLQACSQSLLKEGTKAPAFTLVTDKGDSVSLDQYKGKVVLIDFWASWCGPCRKNNPRLLQVYEKFRNRGFEILGVSIDENRDSWQKAIRQDKLTWPQLISPGGWEGPVPLSYGVDAIPAGFLVDKYGFIRAVNAEGEGLEKVIQHLLGQ